MAKVEEDRALAAAKAASELRDLARGFQGRHSEALAACSSAAMTMSWQVSDAELSRADSFFDYHLPKSMEVVRRWAALAKRPDLSEGEVSTLEAVGATVLSLPDLFSAHLRSMRAPEMEDLKDADAAVRTISMGLEFPSAEFPPARLDFKEAGPILLADAPICYPPPARTLSKEEEDRIVAGALDRIWSQAPEGMRPPAFTRVECRGAGGGAQVRRGDAGGFTLPEFFLVMVLGVGMIATMLFFDSMSSKAKNNHAIEQALSIAHGVRSLYSEASNYDGLSSRSLIAAGMVPASALDAGRIKTPWNGDVEVASEPGGSGFSVMLRSVPENACAPLALGLEEAPSGLSSISVKGVTNVEWSSAKGIPTPPSEMADLCAAAQDKTKQVDVKATYDVGRPLPDQPWLARRR